YIKYSFNIYSSSNGSSRKHSSIRPFLQVCTFLRMIRVIDSTTNHSSKISTHLLRVAENENLIYQNIFDSYYTFLSPIHKSTILFIILPTSNIPPSYFITSYKNFGFSVFSRTVKCSLMSIF